MTTTTNAAGLLDRALASVADARMHPRVPQRNRRDAEIRACQRAMLDRFQLRIAEWAFAPEENEEPREYHVRVLTERGGLYFICTPGERMKVEIADRYDCGHAWLSGDIQSVHALGEAVLRYEEERGDHPLCRHAE